MHDPLLPHDEADARDMLRWTTISAAVADPIEFAEPDDSVYTELPPDGILGNEVAAVGVMSSEQQAGIAEGGEVETSQATLFEEIAESDGRQWGEEAQR